MKFGKHPPKYNDKTLLLSDYVKPHLIPPPSLSVWREYHVPKWFMYGNDAIGDCTCAAIAHMDMLFTAMNKSEVVFTDTDVITVYSAVSGYNPVTGANDNGAAITDVLNYWQTIGIAGRKILGWASIDHTSPSIVKAAIDLFGAVDIGFQVPQSAMDQFNAGQPWIVVPSDGGNVGGHSVPLFSYINDFNGLVTWSKTQLESWEFMASYCDEAYVVITQDWLDKTTLKNPEGVDLATLEADLKEIAN